MEEEVLQLYVGYLKKMIAMRGRMEYKNVVELMEQGLTVVNFVVCLTNLFKSVVYVARGTDHRVKHWITVNEPYESSLGGYDTAEKAPGRCSKYVNEKCVGGDSGHEVYTLSHNLLLAHAEAVEEFRKCAKCKDGNIGIVRSPMWFEPSEKKSSSEEIVKRALDFTLGWHLESVTQGDYPLTMKDSVVTSAFVAHVDNVDQEKPSCEFSLQITFTKSRWVQDWFSGQAYSQNRPTNGRSFLGKVSLPGTYFVPHSDAGTGGSGSVNIRRQLLFVSLPQTAASDAASERRVLRLTPIKPAVAT
ncbi:hypothetical protein F2Q68_00019074 [Brassica cretica]|uniref:thioglucosidase n=1 Tax=Brassica cretica TaxID=69181 RepID=A0A8S9G0H9_BRACR|nr:hypothetical protein F2Q68_00019074 [Brassica cretica]